MIKPSKIAQLKKEKAIGAIEGWTDTINWTTQSVAALKGKKDQIKIDWHNGSQPEICIDMGGLSAQLSGVGSKIKGLDFVGTDYSESTIGEPDGAFRIKFYNGNPNVDLSVHVADPTDTSLSVGGVDITVYTTVQSAWMWRPSSRTFANTYYQYNRTIRAASVGSNLGDGIWYLIVDNATGNSTISQTPLQTQDLALSSCFQIATIQDGMMRSGICSMPVVYVYEN